MAKSKDQKSQLLASLEDKFSRAKAVVLVQYQGLKVKDSERLRGVLRQASIDMIVPKNSIVKIALSKAGIELTGDAFDHPLALVFGYDDEVRPAKEIVLFAKTYQAMEILGGVIDKKMVDASTIKALAALPSREQLLAQMLGSLQAPVRGLVTVLSGVPRALVTVLVRIQEQKTT